MLLVVLSLVLLPMTMPWWVNEICQWYFDNFKITIDVGYLLSQTPFVIGIFKSFFNLNGVGYNIGYVFDVLGYDIRGADFLTSGILSKQLCWLCR